MNKCVPVKHFLILTLFLISNYVSAESDANRMLVPSLELPRKVAKRITFLKSNISNIDQVPQFVFLAQCIEQGQTLIAKDIIQAGLNELNQYGAGLNPSQHAAQADLIKQYSHKIKSDINDLAVVLVERSLPSCCQNTTCCTAAPVNAVINNACTKPSCLGATQASGNGNGVFDGKVVINSTAESTDCASGALTVKGGVGISGDLNVCGKEHIFNRSASIDCNHGALVVAGGVGIGLNLNVCGDVAVASTTESTDCYSGASVIAGGQAIGGNLNVCGQLHVFNDTNSTSCTDGAVVIDGALGIGKNTTICGLTHIQNTTDSTKCTEGALVVDGGAGFGKNVNICGEVHIFDQADSTACNNGALVVDGGVGIGQDVNICGNLDVVGVISTYSYFAINGSSVLNSNIANCNLSVGDNTNPIANGYSNTAVGESAMQNNQLGVRGTAEGCQALQSNVVGNDDTAIGAQSLVSLSGSDRNTACGSQTSFAALDVDDTVAVGYAALHDNQRSENTACGSYALTDNTFGLHNTAVGFEAAKYNLGYDTPPPIDFFVNPGSNLTAVGWGALKYNLFGYNNTAVGMEALEGNLIGYHNVAVGSHALYYNELSYNTAVGDESMVYNTVGAYNVGVGMESLLYNIGGFYNTAVGTFNMEYNVAGALNTSVGFETMGYNVAGFYNTVVGANSLDEVVAPLRNTIIGYHSVTSSSLLPIAQLTDNATLGYQTLEYTKTNAQTAVGTQALQKNIYGVRNTAVGYQALQSNIGVIDVDGYDNTAVGYKAVQARTTGVYNTAIGSQIVLSSDNTTPTNKNTVAGAMANIDGGSNNVLIGYYSFIPDVSGDNVVVGTYAQSNSSNLGFAINNCVTVGYAAYVVKGEAAPALGAITIGASSYTQSEEGINIGYQAYTGLSDRSITIGSSASSQGIKNILIGAFASTFYTDPAKGDNVVVGDSDYCFGYGNTVVGSITPINGTYNTLLGYYVNNPPAGAGRVNTLTYSTQVGAYAAAAPDASYTTLVGANAFSFSAGATLVGAVSKSTGSNSVGVGYMVHPYGNNSVAVGGTANSNAVGSIAIGYNSKASPVASNAIAIGTNSSANGATDVIIGFGATSPGGVGGNIVINTSSVPFSTINIGGGAAATAGAITIGSLVGHPPDTGFNIFGVAVGQFNPASVMSWNPVSGAVSAGPCATCAVGPLEGEWIGADDTIRGFNDNAEKLLALSPGIARSLENEEGSLLLRTYGDPKTFCPGLLAKDYHGNYLNCLQLDKSFVAMLNIVQRHENSIKEQAEIICSQQSELEELQKKYNRLESILNKIRTS